MLEVDDRREPVWPAAVCAGKLACGVPSETYDWRASTNTGDLDLERDDDVEPTFSTEESLEELIELKRCRCLPAGCRPRVIGELPVRDRHICPVGSVLFTGSPAQYA